MSKSIFKSKSFKIIAAVVILVALAAIVVPFLIKCFFMALLFMLQKPLMALVIISAFLFGMLVQAHGDKVDDFIDGK